MLCPADVELAAVLGCPALQGAIIIVGCLTLIDYPEALYLWRVNRLDLLVWLAAFVVTLVAVGASQ